MNELPKGAFIRSVRIHSIEALQPQAAQSAAAGFIQREAIDERHSARHAEVFRDQRLWFRQAFAANRDSGKFLKGFAADAAIIWKNKAGNNVEQTAGYPFRDATDAVRRNKVAPTREQATRENSPPSPNPNSSVHLKRGQVLVLNTVQESGQRDLSPFQAVLISTCKTGSAAAGPQLPSPYDPGIAARAWPAVPRSSCCDTASAPDRASGALQTTLPRWPPNARERHLLLDRREPLLQLLQIAIQLFQV